MQRLAGFAPKLCGHGGRVDPEITPPGAFITAIVEGAMMSTTEWDGELVTHFSPEGPWLGKAEVVSI
jgi:hypothetical protein